MLAELAELLGPRVGSWTAATARTDASRRLRSTRMGCSESPLRSPRAGGPLQEGRLWPLWPAVSQSGVHPRRPCRVSQAGPSPPFPAAQPAHRRQQSGQSSIRHARTPDLAQLLAPHSILEHPIPAGRAGFAGPGLSHERARRPGGRVLSAAQGSRSGLPDRLCRYPGRAAPRALRTGYARRLACLRAGLPRAATLDVSGAAVLGGSSLGTPSWPQAGPRRVLPKPRLPAEQTVVARPVSPPAARKTWLRHLGFADLGLVMAAHAATTLQMCRLTASSTNVPNSSASVARDQRSTGERSPGGDEPVVVR